MAKCIFLVVLAFAAFVQADDEGKIVGGYPTDITNHPYQVAVEVSNDDQTVGQICGGSIINSRCIVTAAHCFENFNYRSLYVHYGSTNKYYDGTYVKASGWKTHPQYVSSTKDYDVAVIKLSEPMQFSNKAQPIQLVPSALSSGTTMYITGWGTTSSGGTSVENLLAAQVQINTQTYCKKQYNSTPRMLCASAPNTDTCQGDSGGPLAYWDGGKWWLGGIVSYGYKCAEPDYPGVYTDTANPEIANFINTYCQ